MTFSTSSIDADNSTVISGTTWGYISWPQVADAVSYQWSITGGSSPTTTTNTHLNFSTLTVGVATQVYIRPVNSINETGAWTVIPLSPAASNSYTNLGSVTSRDWILNGMRSSAAVIPSISTVSLFTGRGLIGSATSKVTFPTGTSGSIIFEGSMNTGSGHYEAGFVDASADTSLIGGTWSAGGMSSTPALKFTGIRFSTDNSNSPGVYAFIDGVQLATTTATNPAINDYAEYKVTYSVEGSVTTVSAYRNGTLLLSATGGLSTVSNVRVAIAGGAEAIGNTYLLRGLVSWERLDLTDSLVPRVRAYAYNEGLIAVWDKRDAATSYEYSINGGTTFTSVSTNYVKITGLSNSSTYEFTVRARNAETVSSLIDIIEVTPNAVPSYVSRVLWDGADIFLGLNEISGPLIHNDGLSSRHFIKSETTNALFGTSPLTNDTSGKSVTTSNSMIAHRGFYTGSSSDVTIEAWVKIPNNSVSGRIMTTSNDNGLILGVGNTYTYQLGRNFIYGYNGSVTERTTIPEYKGLQDGRSHVVITKAGSVISMYVNGTIVTTKTSSVVVALSGLVTVGQSSSEPDDTTLSSNISIDSISRYPLALTSSQVLDHFLSGVYLDENVISTSLEVFQGNGEGVARWSNVFGASTYDISIDGGASTYTSVTAMSENSTQKYESSTVKTISGLTNNTSIDIRVKPRAALQSSSLSSWSTAKSIVPSSNKFIYFLDNFNKVPISTSIGSPQFGPNYVINSGVWGISTDGTLYKSNSVVRSTVTVESNKNIYAIFNNISDSLSSGIGFLFRATDSTHFWSIERNTSNSGIDLVYYNGALDSLVWSSGPVDSPVEPSVITFNKFIFIKINNVVVFSMEDPAYHPSISYYMGYRTTSSSTTPMLDDVVVWRVDQLDNSFWQDLNDKDAHVYKGYDKYANSSEGAA